VFFVETQYFASPTKMPHNLTGTIMFGPRRKIPRRKILRLYNDKIFCQKYLTFVKFILHLVN